MTAATTLLIGLGSNWHATANLRAAETALRNLLPSLRLSTPQWPAPLQNSGPDYLNAVAAATTLLPPEAIAVALKAIERQLGRTARRDAICIDLDLLDYGGLELPHLRLPRRDLLALPFFRDPSRRLLANAP